MLKRIIFILFLILMVLGTISMVSANDLGENSDVVSLNVEINKDNSAEIISQDTILTTESSNEGTFTELQNQINSSSNGSTIYLTKDYCYNNDFSNLTGIKIAQSITIDGEGHAIDGKCESPLLLINQAQNVVLKNIVFRNGYNKDMGVITVFNSTNIKFENCTFTENNATSSIVVLANSEYSTFIDCNFSENCVDYGTVYLYNDNYTSFINCNFDDNFAQHTGGALYIDHSHGPSFTSCSFNMNFANDAGAVYLAYTDNATFVDCNFNKNVVEDTGGAIYIENCDYSSFDSCIFDGNTADDAGAIYLSSDEKTSFVNCNFERNIAPYAGGAISMNHSDNPSFDSCDFYGNLAKEGGSVYLTYTNATFIKCSFNDNTGMYKGGAICLDNSEKTSFDSCSFDYNYGSNGGALSINKANTYLNSCTFESNKAINGSCIFVHESNLYSTGSSFSESEAYDEDEEDETILYLGGAIHSIKSALNFVNDSFSDNYAYTAGGDIYSQYSMIFLENISFYNPTSWSFGGSLSFNNDYVKIKRCTFEECSAGTTAGGAIYSVNSILDISSSQFTECDSHFGGAICSLNTDLTIKNDSFKYSSAEYYGGAIYNIYGTLSIDSSDFLYSHAQCGGAIYIRSPQKINDITNNRFLYSSAVQGPRIYVDEYYSEINESGNIYEDIYYVIGDFYGSDQNDDEYENYSNVIVYVLSNVDEHQNDLSFYTHLKDTLNVYVPIPEYSAEVTVLDKDNPTDSIIFLNYNNYENRKILYESYTSYDRLSLRILRVSIRNFWHEELSFTQILSIANPDRDEDAGDLTLIYSSSNNTEINGWWTSSIFDDEININNSTDEYGITDWFYSIPVEEFSFNTLNGEFIFNFEDRGLIANFGNIYDFKSSYSIVQLLNYSPSIDYLPSSYDSRDYDYITPVQNQGIGGNCWAFSGMATLEACLKKITGIDYDFSENNAKNLMSTSSIFGLNIDPNAGGYDTMFMGYLTSWLGPIFEYYDDEYNPLSSISLDDASVYHIQDISFLPARQNSSDNDNYKSAIINYGAISAILDWTENNVSKGLHSICIIGWDDEFNGVDCLGNNAKGAWIFKNSWGTEWGDEGFGYLSYEEKLSEEIAPYMHAYTFTFKEGDIGYQDLYQYDFAGLTEFLCTDTDYVYYKNKFVAKQDEYLSGFSTYFEKASNFTYTININGVENYTSKNYYSSAGYHTIQFDKYIFLTKGDEFEVIIKLTNNNGNNIPICQADDLYKLSYPNNVSFFSYNGEDWIDLYDLNTPYNFAYSGERTNTSQVACIKAFTTLCSDNFKPYSTYMELPSGSIISSAFSVYQLYVYPSTGNLPLNTNITFIFYILDWTDEEGDNFIDVTINDEIYYINIEGEKTEFKTYFDKEGNYTFSAKLKSNHYSSNLVTYNFTVIEGSPTIGSFTELKEIIDNTEEDAIIELDKDYLLDDYFEQMFWNIVIEKSITIDGCGHTLNGLSKSGIFGIINKDCYVNFENINFINAGDMDNKIPGAINSNGKLRISNCNFTNNSALKGGAINSYGGNLTVTNCNFMDNTAEWGSAIYSNNILKVSKCNFTDNYADWGGTIISFGNLTVLNCNFKDNTAEIYGGAIYYDINNENYDDEDYDDEDIDDEDYDDEDIDDEDYDYDDDILAIAAREPLYDDYDGENDKPKRECNIINSQFESNSAHYGGAICSFEDINIFNCTFKNNTADDGGAIISFENCNITDSKFYSNNAEDGGAIFSDYYECYIKNSEFNSNLAEDSGGAIYADSSCYIQSSIFNYNSAMWGGGTIYVRSFTSENELDIKDSNFKSSDQRREIIYSSDATLYLTNTKLVMGNKHAAAVWYDSEDAYSAPLYLIFNNITAVKGDMVDICRLEDIDGNTFRICDIFGILFSESSREIKVCLITYDYVSGGYFLNTSELDYGTYSITGVLNTTTDYTSIVGTLNITGPVPSTEGSIKTYGNNKLTMTLRCENGEETEILTIENFDFIDDIASLESAIEDIISIEQTHGKVDLSINVDVKPSYENNKYNSVGTIVPWTVTVTANGGTSYYTKVLEVFSNNLGYISYNATRGEYDPINGVWDIGELKDSENASLTIFTQLKSAGTYINKVYAITDDEDVNLLNNFIITSMKTGSVKITSNITSTSDDRTGAQHNIHQASTYTARFDIPNNEESANNENSNNENNNDQTSNSGNSNNENNNDQTSNSGNSNNENSGSGSTSQNSQESISSSISKTISIWNIFNLDDGESNSKNNLFEFNNGVQAYDYTQIPILIFTLFLITLVAIVGYDKIKSKS